MYNAFECVLSLTAAELFKIRDDLQAEIKADKEHNEFVTSFAAMYCSELVLRIVQQAKYTANNHEESKQG